MRSTLPPRPAAAAPLRTIDAMARDSELRGVIYVASSGMIFVAMSSIIKIVTPTIPVLEVSVLRSILSIPLFFFLIQRIDTPVFRSFLTRDHFLRSAFGYANFLCFVFCISKLPLAVASALFYTAPIWSLLLSVFVLNEKHGAAPILTLILGFFGMLAIIQPSIGDMNFWILVGLVGAALGSLAMTMVRRLSVAEAPDRIALGFMLWSSAIGLPLAIPQWVWSTPDQWLLLSLIGVLATLAQVALTRGYALARLARGAPFDFIRLPASLFIGLVFFAEYPTPLMWCGVGLIVIGSAITMAEKT